MLNASLPQLLRRQVFVLSAHQVVIGKELEVCLRNLQAFFLYILACKDVCVRNQVVFSLTAVVSANIIGKGNPFDTIEDLKEIHQQK